MTITQDGTVIDGADIRSGVRIVADNVTIKRSRIAPTSCGAPHGCFVVDLAEGHRGLLLEDVEVGRTDDVRNIDRAVSVEGDGRSPETPRAAIRRSHIHNTYRGILVGNHTVIEDSYIEDLDSGVPPEAHVGAIGAHGATGVTIQRNTVGPAERSQLR